MNQSEKDELEATRKFWEEFAKKWSDVADEEAKKDEYLLRLARAVVKELEGE